MVFGFWIASWGLVLVLGFEVGGSGVRDIGFGFTDSVFFVQLRRVYSPANSRDKSASLSKYYGIYQRKGLAL